MIKFLGECDGRTMIGLGLSRGNCQRLLEGKPILIDLKAMMAEVEPDDVADLNDATILIFGGEDETHMQQMLERGTLRIPRVLKHHEEN